MDYLATFYTHYGAMSYDKHCRKNNIPAKLSPVPRSISASCGTCVRFTAQVPPRAGEHEDMERCYIINGNEEYTKIDG